jgi:hypothetical protein
MGNNGMAGVGLHDWTGMIGWLRITAFSRTATTSGSGGFQSGSGLEHSRSYRGRTDKRGYNRTNKPSITRTG